MAEFKLGRIRFVWKGDWSTAQTYYIDDVVRYGGKTYICTAGHVSDSSFYTDLENNPTRWNQLTDGQAWQGDWEVDTFYKENDIVKYGGLLYICNDFHTSAATTALGLENDQSKWTLYAEGFDWKNDWAINTRYKVNDLVKYGGITYVCNTHHTSAATTILGLENDQSKWDSFNQGIEYRGTWSGSYGKYIVNDVVKYGGSLWICITNHTTTVSFAADSSNWTQFVEGVEFESDWDSGTTYQPGDIVRYGGNQYISKTVNSSQTPSTSSANWDLFTEGFRFQQDWSSVTSYRPGDVVRLRGYTYLSKTDNANQEPPNATHWERLNSGISWQGEWIDDIEYKLGDVVRYDGNTYICILGHRSEGDDGSTLGAEGGGAANSRPDLDTSGTYWNTLSVGSDISVLNTQGDLVYFGGSGPTRLPIGREGQVLRAGAEIPEWVTLGEVDNVYYVAPHGTDLPSPVWGKTFDKPFKTIRYACEQVEKGARNPNAQTLLEYNRIFIQREVTAWIRYQIDNATVGSIWENFEYNDFKCERDVGFIIDRLINDIGQGGNLKIRSALQTFLNALDDGPFSTEDDSNGTGPYNNLAVEAPVSSAAYGYMLELIEDVLANTEPTTIYQNVTDDSVAIATQYTDLTLVAEPTAVPEIRSLVGLITGIFDTYSNTSGDDAAKRAAAVATIPERYIPAKLIRIATGRYQETLPIIVPAYTCVQGDELRSTKAGPAGSLVDISDSYYTVDTFDHISGFIGDIVTGQTITPTTGNTTSQYQAWPAADTDSGVDSSVIKLVEVMKHRTDFSLNTMHLSTLTDPTGYNTSYLSGYGDARKLIKENKKFLQEEVIEYLEDNYSTLECIGSISGTTLTVTSVATGKIGIGMLIKGAAITSGTRITAQLTGTTEGVGTYTVSISQTAISDTIKGSNLYSRTLTRRDVGYIIDALIYDLTYDGNALSVAAGLAYFDGDDDTQPQIPLNIKASVLGSLEFLKTRAMDVAKNVTIVPLQSRAPQFRDTAGSDNARDAIEANIDDIIAIISGGPQVVGSTVTLTDPTPSNGVNSTTTLINEYNLLEGGDDFDQVKDVVEAYLAANYSDVDYSVAKARRDAGIVLKAIGHDFMFNSNYQTIKAAHAYLRPTSSELFDTDDRIKEATRNALIAARDEALTIISDSTAESRLNSLYDIVDTIIYGGSNEGDVCQTENRNRDYAIHQLERNRQFIMSEVSAYIGDQFSDTATATSATGNVITISDTSWLKRNVAIKFTGTTFGGIVADQTYYVQNIVNGTTFTIGSTRDATTAVTLTTASGSSAVELVYNQALCLRDVETYIDALKWDLKYTSNYKSRFVARYYVNAVKGSQEEDMYYLRDATGVRDQTLEGLNGDLTTPNAYGTSRVTAGAYCSLDPGWGPADFRTWILSRSPYIQGVTTFGNAAIGQKIDGALHNGGNDSMVSNDFTQVISDGIGAWVENNGRAELVSVFSYYAHIGYLGTNGGRIRGTNGNNSYGDFGAVAEGFDNTEVPNSAVVDNYAFDAVISNVITDGSAMLAFEFDNAGIDYTDVTYILLGGGVTASAIGNEFRDDAVFQVRLIETATSGDGEFGGSGYKTNSNTAQGGSSSTITLAATDPESNTAYDGMRVVITGGNGVGQYAVINGYNSGTKVANIYKESDLPSLVSGWDHFVPGTTLVNADASSTYTIEPRVTFSGPGFSNQQATGLASGSWEDVIYGETSVTYTSLSGSYSGSGASGAQFTVIRTGWKYNVLLQSGGTDYTRLETITIAGTSLGGLTPQNDLVITITAVNSITGEIVEFDHVGYGIGGRFVAVKGGSTDAGAYSDNGVAWTAMTLPTTGDWRAVTHGKFQDESSLNAESRFVAVRYNSDQAAFSSDGITWTAATLPATANWSSVTFGNGRFVAVGGTTTAVSLDGEVWSFSGTVAASVTHVSFGRNKFIAVRGVSTDTAYSSTDGVTWTSITLPATATWVSTAYGMNKFVAVASDSNSGAFSETGNDSTWAAMSLGSLDGSTVAGYQRVRYGQGLFIATAYINGDTGYSSVAVSETGIKWVARGTDDYGSQIDGYKALAFGNPQREGKWVALQYASGTFGTAIRTGATARGRVSVAEGKIFEVKILEPGSGYDSAPTMTITDPNNLYEAPVVVRTGRGVLANPTFTNRGSQYVTGSAEVDNGDGYADFFQPGSFVAVRRITQRPVSGSNVVFSHLPDRTFKLVNVITFLGTNDGAYTAFFQISPSLTNSEAPAHLTSLNTRIRYSQVRLTGHDFLDIGTGSFAETNYPGGVPENTPDQSKETVGNNGGRIFYTATDQDGNFRVGELFSIEQSTGIATLNADAFNISGLQELNLGNVTLGGGSATITEFSTDPFFTADSDNIVPTQRAIKAFIAGQIGGGGASLNVNAVTAGSILINSNQITTTSGVPIKMNATFEFRGGVIGLPIAFNYFLT